MEVTALKHLLESLCNDSSVWNYAVLWKLRPGTPMMLTWEDGFFNPPKSGELADSGSFDSYCNAASDMFSLHFDSNASSSGISEYPVELIVADMLSFQYVYGEGVVGKVAALEDYCWSSISQIFTGDVDSIPECPEEWLLQFASGIKTILLIPVLPHGVLQLGSVKEISDDINEVAYVKERFSSLHGFGEITEAFNLKKEFQTLLASAPYPTEPSTSSLISVKTEDLDHLATSNIVEPDNADLANASLFQPQLTVQDALMPSGDDLSESFTSEIDNNVDVPLAEVSSLSTMDGNQLEVVESKLFELSCLMEELQAYSNELQGYSNSNDINVSVISQFFNGMTDINPASNTVGEPHGGKYAVDMDDKTVSSFIEFPKGSELHKAIEPALRKQTNLKSVDISFLAENSCSPSKRPELSWFARGGDAGYLLEAVVAKACSSSDGGTFGKSGSFKSSSSFSRNEIASPKTKKQDEAGTFLRDSLLPQSHLTSKCITEYKDGDCSSDTLRSMTSKVFCKDHKEKDSADLRLKMDHKTSSSGKRRSKPGDNQRPRPRDRQLIQDRVKELRELVPNGAKCSIDGLLERTIKHMMYLRSVTDQSEKLKQCAHKEICGRNNLRFSKTKENYQNGTSWAFEYGNEFQVCPIAVEDLAYPGQMLIEMICSEHSLFLEIAQVIRGLDLTILKGVLENRSNNTWAHFIVEASKGFHRLDIFWPLMQLLQRKRKSISSKI